jgi:hypothetical protein
MNRRRCVAGLAFVVVLGAGAARLLAQAPTASGHWAGSIETPGQPLKIEVDLKPSTGQDWIGTISIPAQGLKAFPLSDVQVQGRQVSFAMPQVPGTPTFKGELTADGAGILGDFSQGEGKTTFELKRAGEASITPPPKSTAITKELEGQWSGTLEAGGQQLRLTLKLASGADGATGSIVSLDQGNAEIPIESIVQTGSHLELILPKIAGSFSGDLKDGKLAGEWKQGPGTLPLTFTRVP